MKNLLMIPKLNELKKCEELAEKWNMGFEYNDFFFPSLLDDEKELENRISLYQKYNNQFNTLHGVFFDIIVASYDDKIKAIAQERIYQSLSIARRLGCKKVVFHTNIDPSLLQQYYLDNWLEKNTIFWKKAADDYSDILIVIENMFDKNPIMQQRLLAAIDKPNVRACLDLAHAFISGTPIQEWIDVLGEYISHIHINDNNGIVDSHDAIGDGVMDYASLIPYLNSFDGSVLIEVSSIEKLTKSLENLRKLGLSYE